MQQSGKIPTAIEAMNGLTINVIGALTDLKHEFLGITSDSACNTEMYRTLDEQQRRYYIAFIKDVEYYLKHMREWVEHIEKKLKVSTKDDGGEAT
jgi:uncharacterized radical SAM superfamily Fe-S cluster-containing enzyme